MSEIEELKQLVAQQRRDMQTQNAVMKAQSDANQNIGSDLLARASAPPAVVMVPEAGAMAAAAAVVPIGDKVNKLSIALKKSYEVKGCREVNDMSIREWLTMFHQEVSARKWMYGVTDDLTCDGIVELFKHRMDHLVDLLFGGSLGDS